jgi:hypothetical protein
MAIWIDIGFFNISRRFLRRCIDHEVKLKASSQEEKTKKNMLVENISYEG